MIVKQVYNNQDGKLHLPKEVLPANGQPFAHHFQSTDGDNLIELAGRVCFDKDTELLTESGWVKISELPKGVAVLTLNRESNLLEYQKPYNYIHQKFTGSMVYLDNQFLKIKTTDNHEWYVNLDNKWQLIEAKKLFGYKFYIRRSGNFIGNDINEFIIPDHVYTQKIHTLKGIKNSKPRISPGFKIPNYKLGEFAKFLGYYFSEGCVNGGFLIKKSGKKSSYNIKIYQHANSAEPIRNCIKKLGFKYSEFLDTRDNVIHFSIYEAVLARYLQKFGSNSYEKFLPRECLNWPSNLRNLLLNSMMYGDGGKQYGHQRIYSTKSKKLADDIQELIIKNNKTCTLNINTESTYIIRECNTENSTVNNPSTPLLHEAVKNEDVYCVSVNNRILVTRYNNCVIFCGNCYDSAQMEKTRGTVEYHRHINEVNHGSTQEHLNITYDAWFHAMIASNVYRAFANKPGFYLESWQEYNDDNLYRFKITGNLRAIKEWYTFNPNPSNLFNPIGYALQSLAKEKAPLAIGPINAIQVNEKLNISLGQADGLNHIWASYYIGGVSRGLCYDEETEVLTEKGWKYFKDVNIEEDLFATLNTANHNLEYQRAVGKTDENWSGEMYKIKSTMVDLLVTPNHRMYIQPIDTQKYRRKEQQFIIKQAKDIIGKRVNYKKNANWTGLSPKFMILDGFDRKHGKGIIKIGQQKYLTKDFVEFLGYFISEGYTGHTKGSSYTVNICQNEGDKLDKIVDCINRLKFNYNIKDTREVKQKIIQIYNHSLFNYLNVHCGKGSFNKKIPAQIKTFESNLINILLDAIILGDCNIHKKNGHRVIYTSSKVLADDLQELILKTGLSASIRIDDRVGKERIGKWSHIKQTQPNYIVSISNQNSQHPTVNAAKKQDELIQYNGRVYCVTVPNSTLYVRRNGIPVWSGNTHELVRHKYQTGISQRSTRYVDESKSEWAWHPLILKYQKEIKNLITPPGPLDGHFDTGYTLNSCHEGAKEYYNTLVKFLETRLVTEGLDKHTARKQARGAARGVLGNALSTELVFSASLAQWQRIILMRSRDEADAEIRLMTNKIFEDLKEKWPEHFYNYQTRPAKDGIGIHVEKI